MSEYNICGLLVTTRPELGSVIERILKAVDGIEVHAREAGRIVATIEGTQCTETIKDLGFVNGVISSSPFHLEAGSESLLGKAAY